MRTVRSASSPGISIRCELFVISYTTCLSVTPDHLERVDHHIVHNDERDSGTDHADQHQFVCEKSERLQFLEKVARRMEQVGWDDRIRECGEQVDQEKQQSETGPATSERCPDLLDFPIVIGLLMYSGAVPACGCAVPSTG